MARFEIVWRNPNQIKNQLRYSPQSNIGDRKLYTVQQLLSGVHDIWVNTSVLEVVSRRPAQPTQPRLPRLWHFEFGS